MAYTKEQRDAKKNQSQNTKQNENNEKKDVVIKTISIKNLPPSTTSVWVKNNVYGGLIYVSQKTGFKTAWEEYGTKQPITLEELIIMRNSQISFFEQNWIMIDSFVDSDLEDVFSVQEILEYLQIKQYYKDSLCPDNIDDVFMMSPDDIENKVSKMSNGVKEIIIVRANGLIESGEIYNLKIIRALEKALNCKFDLES